MIKGRFLSLDETTLKVLDALATAKGQTAEQYITSLVMRDYRRIRDAHIPLVQRVIRDASEELAPFFKSFISGTKQ